MKRHQKIFFENNPGDDDKVSGCKVWFCYYCGKKLDEISLTVDHYIPISKGGKDNPENLVPACSRCNRLKADMLPLGSSDQVRKQIQSIKDSIYDKIRQKFKTRRAIYYGGYCKMCYFLGIDNCSYDEFVPEEYIRVKELHNRLK